MAKQIKSIRFDTDILDIFNEYASWQQKVFEDEISFSAFLNQAVINALENACSRWSALVQANSVIERTTNGNPRIHKFSKAQIDEIALLANKCKQLSVNGDSNGEREKAKHSLAQIVKTEMEYDTILSAFHITKSNEESLNFLATRFDADVDSVLNCLIAWASLTDNYEAILAEINE